MRRWLPHLGIVLGLTIAAYALFFGSSEEDRIRALLEQLEDAVAVRDGQVNLVLRGARIRKEFSEIFVKQVKVEIPELSQATRGRRELVGLATHAPQRYSLAVVDLDGLKIFLDDAEMTAVASGDAVLTASRRGAEVKRDTRAVSLRLDKIEGAWRIVSASVGRAETSEQAGGRWHERLIIAQARVLGAPVLTADPAFSRYPIDVVWD